jgi:hypothetical protein
MLIKYSRDIRGISWLRTTDVPKMSVILNQPTCLIAGGDLINYSHSDSFRSYMNTRVGDKSLAL